jgi:hypothetical protein
LTVKKLEMSQELWKRGMTGGFICVVAYLGYLSVKEIAGKTTAFSTVMDVAAKLHVSEFACLAIVALCGGSGAYWYRAFRKAEKAAGRAKGLELRLDPNRTSSLNTVSEEKPDEGQS